MKFKKDGGAALRLSPLSVAVLFGSSLTACTSVAPTPYDLPAPDAGPAVAPAQSAAVATLTAPATKPARRRRGSPSPSRQARLGAPYSVNGVWYTPAEQRDYDEVGLASWYGEAFHGRATASGEAFDMDAISAAHATLPIPSIVEVTNLDNGRTLNVRLNDRGPFHPGRIIDLSKAAARSLGFYEQGTARVRVRFISSAPVFTQASLTTAARTPPLRTLAPSYGPAHQKPQASVLAAYSPAEPFGPLLQDVSYRPPDREAFTGYWLQAGAYGRADAARRAAARLQTLGGTAVTPITSRGGGRLFRLGVGPFSSLKAAEAARAQAAALGVPDCRVKSAN